MGHVQSSLSKYRVGTHKNKYDCIDPSNNVRVYAYRQIDIRDSSPRRTIETHSEVVYNGLSPEGKRLFCLAGTDIDNNYDRISSSSIDTSQYLNQHTQQLPPCPQRTYYNGNIERDNHASSQIPRNQQKPMGKSGLESQTPSSSVKEYVNSYRPVYAEHSLGNTKRQDEQSSKPCTVPMKAGASISSTTRSKVDSSKKNAPLLQANPDREISTLHQCKTREPFSMQGVSCMEYEEMVAIFQPLIINNLNVREILPLLPFLQDHDCIYALERISPKQAVVGLLEKLKLSNEFGKWHKFIEALGACGYEYIVKNIRGYRFVDLRYQGCYIKSLTPKLSKIIKPVELLSHLHAEEVIGQNDKEEIEMEDKNCGSIAAAILLFTKLPKKHSKWYVKFIRVLRKVGYEEIADDLEIPNLVEPYDSIDSNQHSSLCSSVVIEYEETVEIFKPLIVKNLIVREVLPYLTFIDDHASIYAVEKASPRDAVIRLLEKLKISNVPGKWHKFIETLSACGYEYIVKNIKGYMFAYHNYQEDYVKSLTPKLSKVLPPMVLLPCLHAEDVISQNDREEIEMEYRNRGNIAASTLLLNRIPRKSSKWYTKLISVLRKEGFDEIADDLDIPSLIGSDEGEAKTKTSISNSMPICPACKHIIKPNERFMDHLLECSRYVEDCSICGLTFKKKSHVLKHMSVHHKSSVAIKVATDSFKKHGDSCYANDEKYISRGEVETLQRELDSLSSGQHCNKLVNTQMILSLSPRPKKRKHDTSCTFEYTRESSSNPSQLSPENEDKPILETNSTEPELKQQTVSGDTCKVSENSVLVSLSKSEMGFCERLIEVKEGDEVITRNTFLSKRRNNDEMVVNIRDFLPNVSIRSSELELCVKENDVVQLKFTYRPDNE